MCRCVYWAYMYIQIDFALSVVTRCYKLSRISQILILPLVRCVWRRRKKNKRKQEARDDRYAEHKHTTPNKAWCEPFTGIAFTARGNPEAQRTSAQHQAACLALSWRREVLTSRSSSAHSQRTLSRWSRHFGRGEGILRRCRIDDLINFLYKHKKPCCFLINICSITIYDHIGSKLLRRLQGCDGLWH